MTPPTPVARVGWSGGPAVAIGETHDVGLVKVTEGDFQQTSAVTGCGQAMDGAGHDGTHFETTVNFDRVFAFLV